MAQPQSPLDDDELLIARANEQLDQAAYLYSVREDKNGNDDGGRSGVRIALHAAMEILKACGANGSQLKPLNRISAALDDLDFGKVSDVLVPKKTMGRPRNSYEHELLKALAVASLDLFMVGGMSEKDGSMLVARRLSKHGYKITKNRKASSASVIRGWRKNVDLNRVRDERDNTLRDLGHIEGTNEAKAEKLLQQLPGIVSVKS
ncbi:MAG: hypothetical protein HQ513_16450 [Rhodospirillales bacterium]|nr:hypothetical protein [Rhodospirillales bacterium]